jgi:hypothetical protein
LLIFEQEFAMKKLIRNGLRSVLGIAAAGICCGSAWANNVAATVEGSLLVIAGDNLANQITVARSANGDVVVSGQNGTLINRLPSVRFPRLQLNAAEIRMGAGNDVLTLRGLQVANDLFVELGDGADRLNAPAASPTVVGGNLAIEGNAGNDTIRTEGTVVGLDYYLDGGIGVLNATVINSMVGFNVVLIGDEANDVMALTGVAAGGDVMIESKGGSDRVTLTTVSALLLAVSTDANAVAGADRVTLDTVVTVEDIGIFTGPGNDIVQMIEVQSGKNLTVSADSGSDRVSGAGVEVTLDAVFEGGAGTDTFEDFGITGGVKKDVKEFEIFLP